jgi:hypothetical protein
VKAVVRVNRERRMTDFMEEIEVIRTSQKESCTGNALSKKMHSCFLLENLLGTFKY